jgi:vancomycin permeability regulator SanA
VRGVARALGVLIVLVAVYATVTFAQVWDAARSDDAQPAQAIVVLGAAQYDGRPSPVLRARLDHAADLYHRELAPIVVVTGGSRPGDRFTEATAGATYLHQRGVPDVAIRREVSGRSTYESLAATARFLRTEDVSSVLLVSDRTHSYRIRAIAEDIGLEAHVSPTPRWGPRPIIARALARETAAVAVGRVIGYRRITGIGQPLQAATPTQEHAHGP